MRRAVLFHAVLAGLLLASGCRENPQDKTEALLRAVRSRDIEQVRALIADGAQLDARDTTGKTPLFQAAASGNEEIAELLIAHGADIDLADRWGFTPLHAALRGRSAQTAEALINAGARVSTRSHDDETPLHAAAEIDDMEIVRLLIRRGADVNATTSIGDTPLLRAARQGRYDVAQYLIAEGADVNIRAAEEPATPLHAAVEIGHKPLVQLLLDSGAAVDTADLSGRTPAVHAMHENFKGIVTVLVATGANVDLHLAAYLGDLETAKRLLDSGTDVNLRDSRNWTPLHYAAQQGQANVAEYLLANGAYVNAINKYDYIPLQSATKHLEVTKILVEHGADLDAGSQSEQTALQRAISHGDKKVVDFLINRGAKIDLHTAAYIGRLDKVKEHLANGADINLRPPQMDSAAFEELFAIYGEVPPEPSEPRGDTPLHRAVEGGHADIVEYLAANGADLKARDNGDWTPLHDAAYLGFTEIAKILISHGAETNLASEDGETPLHIAAEHGHTSTVELLIANGADTTQKDRHGRTAMDYAWDRGFADVVALLGGDANDSELARKKPYTVIIRDPNAVKGIFLSSECDDAWIPTEADLEGLDQILKSYLMDNTTIPTETQIAREHVLAHLRCYSREYGGFVSDGTRFILCNLVMADLSRTPSRDRFTYVFDAWWSVTQVIFDAEKRTVIRVDCT